MKPTSKGYYYIGVQSYDEISYSISVTTKQHNALLEDGKSTSEETFLDIDPIYIGPQDADIYLSEGKTKYFYFQNWREESIKFTLSYLNQHFMTTSNIKMEVGQGRDNSQVLNKPPQFKD